MQEELTKVVGDEKSIQDDVQAMKENLNNEDKAILEKILKLQSKDKSFADKIVKI